MVRTPLNLLLKKGATSSSLRLVRDSVDVVQPVVGYGVAKVGQEALLGGRETECPNSLRNGIGYLSGFVAGTGKGLVEGIKASEPRDTLKLHMNQVLNASGHTGWRLGNLAGHRAAIVAIRGSGNFKSKKVTECIKIFHLRVVIKILLENRNAIKITACDNHIIHIEEHKNDTLGRFLNKECKIICT
ncbi:hypothetical protein RJ639_040001 [Escallonia herrerae]|uniref:Uncharacterized protein n=1 Tax=Escallonia herrerae TaxID=1293975 RepID=A0AA88WLF7_9ASTE|nr:hypothetical protein RJ639_040001 [Escallonia herrerae]